MTICIEIIETPHVKPVDPQKAVLHRHRQDLKRDWAPGTRDEDD